jgi:hypothetical protein
LPRIELHPDRSGARADDRLSAAGSKSKQEDLGSQGDVADFVEEQRSLLGPFDPALFLADGPGEGALFMAKEPAPKQVRRVGRTIDDDERPLAAMVPLVDGKGDQLLAGMEETEVFPGVVCAGVRAQEEVTDAMLLHEDGQAEQAPLREMDPDYLS